MKRLFKSSNFWNAVFATLLMVGTVLLVTSETEKDLILYEFILFGGRTAVSGFADILKTHKGIGYNPATDRDEKI